MEQRRGVSCLPCRQISAGRLTKLQKPLLLKLKLKPKLKLLINTARHASVLTLLLQTLPISLLGHAQRSDLSQ